jgi:hypothetical protein
LPEVGFVIDSMEWRDLDTAGGFLGTWFSERRLHAPAKSKVWATPKVIEARGSCRERPRYFPSICGSTGRAGRVNALMLTSGG